MKVVGENEVRIQLVSSTGPQGPQGPAGTAGKDYVLTEADKQEIAGMVEVPGGVGAAIDDTTHSTTTTYSSQKIESELSALNEANAAQDTEIAKKANDAELAKVAKSGSYTDLTNKPTIPTVPSTLPNPNALTFTGAVNETYDGSAAKSVAIPTVPTTLPNPSKLILSGAVTAEYDGSAPVSVEIPAGGSGSYTLPVASAAQLGGVMPAAKTDEMTQAVGVDDAGGLWTAPGEGSSGNTDAWELLLDVTTDEVVYKISCTPEKKYEEYYMYIKANAWNKADDVANGTAAFSQLQFSVYGNLGAMVNALVYSGTEGKFVESGCLVKKFGDVYRMLAFGNNGNKGLPGTVYTNNGFRSDSPTEITDLNVVAANSNTTQFAVGSVCRMWGRHAL